jgi:hypothetical protein
LQSSSNSRMSSACGSVGEEPRVSVTMLGCADEHERSNNLYQSVGVLCAQVRCMAPGWEVAVLPRPPAERERQHRPRPRGPPARLGLGRQGT